MQSFHPATVVKIKHACRLRPNHSWAWWPPRGSCLYPCCKRTASAPSLHGFPPRRIDLHSGWRSRDSLQVDLLPTSGHRYYNVTPDLQSQYLVHDCVGSYNVVGVGPQTSQGCRGVWLHLLDSYRTYCRNNNTLWKHGSCLSLNVILHFCAITFKSMFSVKHVAWIKYSSVHFIRPAPSPKHAKHFHLLLESCRSECWLPEAPGRPTGCWVWLLPPSLPASCYCTAAPWWASPRSPSAAPSGRRCPGSFRDQNMRRLS